MSKNKNIQIPVKLFAQMYILVNQIENDEIIERELINSIKEEINDKFDAMRKRSLYTKSLTAETEEEKEKARKEYLDEIGMKDSFRY